MRTILISGAANGLGAAFLEAYQPEPNVEIIAIDKILPGTPHENVEAIETDVSSEQSIGKLTEHLKNRTIDLVIHSAGIRGLVSSVEDAKPNDVHACETVDVMDMKTLTRAFQINAAGTFLLLRALLPYLKRSSSPTVIVMASRMGSIGNNEEPNKDAGAAYAYRASKAAMNAIVRSLAVDVPEVPFILCHPGRVETNLVKCKEEGAITVEESVQAMLPLIARWGASDSGRVYDRFGIAIQW